jgi:hypothetical protein
MIILNLEEKSGLDYICSHNWISQDLIVNKTNLFNLLNQFKISKNIKDLTILLLAPLSVDFELSFSRYASQFNYRIISCNSLGKVKEITEVWPINVIILDARSSAHPINYWLSLKDEKNLANLPLVTLDIEITSAMNQISYLKVFPYLALPENYNLADLFQVINIAIR